ncbi:MAG: aspartate kinase [Candidatus Krumholzibacteriia bacterium]
MASSWIVHKFGGTSLADADGYLKVAAILDEAGGAEQLGVARQPDRAGAPAHAERPESAEHPQRAEHPEAPDQPRRTDEPVRARRAVVVSAMSGVTDALIHLNELASERDSSYTEALDELRRRQLGVVEKLLSESRAKELAARVEADIDDIGDLLRAVWLMRSRPENAVDLVSGYGELWSAQVLAAHLEEDGRSATWLDAREVLVVEPGELAPVVDWQTSRPKLLEWLANHDEELVIVTGFIASNPDGIPTTLGRNGSDYSASIFAALLHGEAIHIWSDVDGVLSADPRQVPDAVVLDTLSYDEAMELAYFGAKVIHPSTMAPAVEQQIPIYIRNTFNPGAPGTRIHVASTGVSRLDTPPAWYALSGAQPAAGSGAEPVVGAGAQPGPGSGVRPGVDAGAQPGPGSGVRPALDAGAQPAAGPRAKPVVESAVKGFASIDGMALVNLEGTGMIGVPGIAERLFGALRAAGVSVVMISQGSSEHSICFAIPSPQADAARDAIERAFLAERQHGQIQTLDVTDGCTILAIVGDDMAGTPGISGKFFGALGKAGVNVRAIAQGSSERNISIVIESKDATRALRAVHSGFYLSNQTLSIGVIGPGLVGSTLLAQIASQVERLRSEFMIDLRVRGITSSSRMLLSHQGIALDRWEQLLETEGAPADFERFVDWIQTDTIPHAVLIDCSASQEIAMRYADWMERGIHVITPNKKANTAGLDYYKRLRRGSRDLSMHYLYETTVGAGLPIIQTLRDLIQTGDEVLQIEGILSGTLSYLFNSFDGTRLFSEIVREARAKGYTEPDPRDDLSGMDVARKVVILAREMGLDLEVADLDIESLVPAELESESADAFLDRLVEFDPGMLALLEEARARDEVLRFVGTVVPDGRSSVRLRRCPHAHPFARIQLTDNIVLFRTRRYHENPLVVQGPGAGPDVTAGGIFADLLRLATYVGATL